MGKVLIGTVVMLISGAILEIPTQGHVVGYGVAVVGFVIAMYGIFKG